MTGLVLEGGAMRGLFTAGVLDVFMENGIRFDNVIGVSAGACFGCNYVSGQIGRTIRYNMKYARDKRYCSITSWLKTGDMFGADFCYRKLPRELDRFDEEAFVSSGIPFYLVVTDVDSGEAGYHLMKDGSRHRRHSDAKRTLRSLRSREVTVRVRKRQCRSSDGNTGIIPTWSMPCR